MTDVALIRTATEAIEIAFVAVSYPGDGNIAYHQDYRPSDGFNCARVLMGKHWREVKPESLLKCAYPFLTPEALHFFLPAYLLGRLRYPQEIDVAGDFIVYGLKPPFGGTMLALIKLLNVPQKIAIKLFLEAIAADIVEPNIAKDAQEALKEHWDKF